MEQSNLERLLSTISTLKQSAKKVEYDCQICRDVGQVESEHGWRMCDCKKKELNKKRMERNGFSPGNMTFNQFKATDPVARKMREMAERFIEDNNKSMAVLGQVGAGKTHLSVAVAQELINRGRDVKYMPYAEIIVNLKQNMFDEAGYNSTMQELKSCGILVIDDLFKGNPRPNDIDIVFQIINYRYLNRKTIIISSEKTMDELINIDEAIGSRIRQMCKEYTLQIARDVKNNRRMK